MTCSVTNGVGVNLGRTNMVEKSFWKLPSNDGTCSGVMGMIELVGTVGASDITKSTSYLGEGFVPRNPFEISASLFS